MEFSVFSDDKMKKIAKENQADVAEKRFEIPFLLGSWEKLFWVVSDEGWEDRKIGFFINIFFKGIYVLKLFLFRK